MRRQRQQSRLTKSRRSPNRQRHIEAEVTEQVDCSVGVYTPNKRYFGLYVARKNRESFPKNTVSNQINYKLAHPACYARARTEHSRLLIICYAYDRVRQHTDDLPLHSLYIIGQHVPSHMAMLLKPLPPVIMSHRNRLIHYQRWHLLRPKAVPGQCYLAVALEQLQATKAARYW